MALIRIFGKNGLTGLFYVRGVNPKNQSLDLSQDKMTIFAHIMIKSGKLWV